LASSRFRLLLWKELRELSRERIVLMGLLVGPLIMFILIGGFAGVAIGKAVQSQNKTLSNIAIYYDGTGSPPRELVLLARNLSAPIYSASNASIDRLLEEYRVVVVTDNGTATNMSMGRTVSLRVYLNTGSVGVMLLNSKSLIDTILGRAVLKAELGRLKPCMPGATPESLQHPVNSTVIVVLHGRRVPLEKLAGTIMGLTIGVPLAVLAAAVAATQVSALSLVVEKENKTLEKLLTLPISRATLISSKLAAVTLLSLGGVASYMAGLLIYFKIIETASHAGPGFPGFTMSPGLLAYTSAGLILTLYVGIGVGFLVGTLADSVRGAQIASSYTTFILALPLFLVMMGAPVGSLGRAFNALLLLDPYSSVVAGLLAYIAGNKIMAGASLGVLALYGVIVTIVSSMLIRGELIITGSERFKRLVHRKSLGVNR